MEIIQFPFPLSQTFAPLSPPATHPFLLLLSQKVHVDKKFVTLDISCEKMCTFSNFYNIPLEYLKVCDCPKDNYYSIAYTF